MNGPRTPALLRYGNRAEHEGMDSAVVGEGAGRLEHMCEARVRVDWSRVPEAVIAGRRVLKTILIGPDDGRSGRYDDAFWAEGQVVDGDVDGPSMCEDDRPGAALVHLTHPHAGRRAGAGRNARWSDPHGGSHRGAAQDEGEAKSQASWSRSNRMHDHSRFVSVFVGTSCDDASDLTVWRSLESSECEI